MIAVMSQVIATQVVVDHDDRCAGVERIIGIRVIRRRLARGLGLRIIAWASVSCRTVACAPHCVSEKIRCPPTSHCHTCPGGSWVRAVGDTATGERSVCTGAVAAVVLGAACLLLAAATTGALGGAVGSDRPTAVAAAAASASAAPRIQGNKSVSSTMLHCTALGARGEECSVNNCAPDPHAPR
jgi:hypothetical protein